ncbi:hypothetical protein NUM3379_09310 [Kineococcus sp. NUM-3379]
MSASTTVQTACPPAPAHRPPERRDLVLWAAGEAGRLLADLPVRWDHTQEVAIHAWWAAPGFSPREAELLVAAAYLHDIGYSPALVDTGFHPLDGARHLLRLGEPELAALVAHHSGAAVEARHRGLDAELAGLGVPDGAVADALTYCDITTGPRGETVDPGPRLREIISRHGADSVVARARTEARADIFAAVLRTLRRVSRGRPHPEPLHVTPVRLSCTTVLRFEGALDTGATLTAAREALADALADGAHTLVCDLALLRAVDREGAAHLAEAARSCFPRVLLLDPAPGVLACLRAVAPDVADSPEAVLTSIPAALALECGCS